MIKFAISEMKRVIQTCKKQTPRVVSNLSIPENVGLNFAPKVVSDSCTIKTDKTLTSNFLEDLMKIDDADPIKFTTEVRARMLRAMGYSRPELMKVHVTNNSVFAQTFDLANCELSVSEKFTNVVGKADIIALIRHELDHFDKAAQICKSIGVEEYQKALNVRFPRVNYVDKDSWTTMSKEADITNFNINRYLDYFNNPRLIPVKDPKSFDCIRNTHIYVMESMEDSAYNVQKRVLQALKQDDIVPSDIYGTPLKGIINRLDSMGISDERKMEIYSELCDAASHKLTSNPELLMRNYKNLKLGIISEDVQNVLKNSPTFISNRQTFNMLKWIDGWLAKGYTSIDDILTAGAV